MHRVGDARSALAKPREGRVRASLVSCDQDDPGTHLCKRYRGDFANPGRAARNDNRLSPHVVLVSTDRCYPQRPPRYVIAKAGRQDGHPLSHVYFDNVGGEHLEAALTAANRFARFTLCGMISQYNLAGQPDGPRNLILAVGKSLRLEGFIVANHFNLLPEFQKDMSGWIRKGKLTWRETVEQGIENAPTAFLKLFKGENVGK